MSLVSEFLQKVGLIRNETQYHGNTKERVADTFETLFNLDVWFKKLDPQDPNANKIYQADGTLVDLPEGGLATDMSNLDDDILEADKKIIRGKLGASWEGSDNQNTGSGSASVGGDTNENTGNYTASVAGLENKNPGYNSASVGGEFNENDGFSAASVGGSGLQNKTRSETSRGQYNLSESNHVDSATAWHDDDLIESVGGGINNSNRLNLFARYKNGAFYWVKKTLSTITNAVKGFHAADEDGRLNYYDGTDWKKYLLEGEGSGGGELKKIGNGYGLQDQIDNPDNYGTLGQNAVNLSISHEEGYYGATGRASNAENRETTASGTASHAEGDNTIAGSYAENARGSYNEIITPINATTFDSNDVVESVGVGSNLDRKNALTRWKNGAFKWLLQPLSNITNAALGFHAADENGRLNYHDGSVWKPYMTEIKETNTDSEIKFWRGTQAEYDSITTKNPQTLYIIN